jgi:hypothetical protein
MDKALANLKCEVVEIRGRHAQLKPDEAFIVWFRGSESGQAP